MDRRLLLERSHIRFGRPVRAGQSHPDARRGRLPAERYEDVDFKRRRGGAVHDIRQSGRREVHRLSGGAEYAGAFGGSRREEDGHSRLFHHARHSGRCQGSGVERAGGGRQGPPDRLQYPQYGQVEAGLLGRRRSQDSGGRGRQVGQAAHGVRPAHLRFRHDQREAGGDDPPHLCHGEYQLSDHGSDRRAAGSDEVRRNRPERVGGDPRIRRRVFHLKSVRRRSARLRCRSDRANLRRLWLFRRIPH